MGGELARKVVAKSFEAAQVGNPFTPNELAVLLTMATIALDNGAPPLYFGGRDYLASAALGRRTDGASDRELRSIRESLRVALAGLHDRGAINRHGAAHNGRRQEYALTLDLCVVRPKTQAQLAPIPSSRWAFSNDSLPKAQSDIGPKEPEEPHPQDEREPVNKTTSLATVENQKRGAA